MQVYVLMQDNGACGDPECCGERVRYPTGVTTDLNKAKKHGDYEEFELK